MKFCPLSPFSVGANQLAHRLDNDVRFSWFEVSFWCCTTCQTWRNAAIFPDVWGEFDVASVCKKAVFAVHVKGAKEMLDVMFFFFV